MNILEFNAKKYGLDSKRLGNFEGHLVPNGRVIKLKEEVNGISSVEISITETVIRRHPMFILLEIKRT